MDFPIPIDGIFCPICLEMREQGEFGLLGLSEENLLRRRCLVCGQESQTLSPSPRIPTPDEDAADPPEKDSWVAR